MRDLLVAVPSQRPGNVARLWEKMQETCTAGTTLLVGVDEDDPRLGEYPAGPGYVIRPGLHLAAAWINELIVPRTGEYRAVGTLGDDNVPRTRGWDTAILAALEQVPFAFGNDLYPFRPPGELACHVFCRSEVIAALGYMCPPGLRHSYVDDIWTDWGRACGITFLDGVILEHLHPTAGKAAGDETYARAAAAIAADGLACQAYRHEQLAADVARIRAVAARPRWQILIASLVHRHAKLAELLAVLDAQMRPGVRVMVYRDNLEASYAAKLQALSDAATAEYTSVLSDDDSVAPDFIPRVLAAMAGRPDYIGFRVCWLADGVRQRPVIHSLACGGWADSPDSLQRDLMYFNPIRRELATRVRFRGDGCDREWADDLRALGCVRTEAFIDADMHYYRSASGDNFGTARQPLPGPHPGMPAYPWLDVL